MIQKSDRIICSQATSPLCHSQGRRMKCHSSARLRPCTTIDWGEVADGYRPLFPRDAPYTIKQRYIVMDAFDEAVFSLALRDELGDVRFAESGFHQSPEPCWGETIAHLESSVVCVVRPYAGWTPEICELRDGWYGMMAPPLSFRFHRAQWNWQPGYEPRAWAFSLPTIDHGWIAGGYYKGDDVQSRFLRTVWRVLAQVATNKIAGGDEDGRRLTLAQSKGGLYWAGFHVLEWCQAEPRRMLMGSRRPCADWTPPQDARYRRWRRRVETEFDPALFAVERPPPAPPGPSAGPIL